MERQSKLDTYRLLKTALLCEEYLFSPHVAGRVAMTRLRTGTNELRIEQGGYQGLSRAQRLCTVCDQQLVEDERHFMLTCPAYALGRGRMMCGVYMATNGGIDVSAASDVNKRLRYLLGPGTGKMIKRDGGVVQ